MRTDRPAVPPLAFVARAFVASVLLVVVYGVARVSWILANYLLLLGMAAIAGIGLRAFADALRHRIPMRPGVALAIVLLLLLGTPVGVGVALAPQLERQVAEAREAIPQLHQRLDAWLARAGASVREVTGAAPSAEQGPTTEQVVAQLQQSPSTDLLAWVGGFVGGATQAVGGAILALVIAIYLAAAPREYLDGAVALAPLRHRRRIGEVLEELGGELRSWIGGQLLAMVVVGVTTTIGLWVAGVKLALILGMVAGLLDFIPNFGPALALLPALLVAAEDGKVLHVVAIYGAVQVLEGWIVRPLIEQKAVDTLPGVLLATQVLLATLLGFMGLLAAPALLVVAQVCLQRFYVEDVLGDAPSEA